MPFEKIHNQFCKNILGVHKKSSNFAAKCELGRPPVLNFITILALKYFKRLKQLPSDRLLGEVYEVDQSLFIDEHRSWQKFIHNSLQNLNLTSLDFDRINQLLTDQHSKVILNKLQHLSTQEHDNKLFFFANIYPKDFILQDYLSLKLPVNITRELTKLRLSSHSLLIEKGRYFRPKIKRENRLCSQCNQIEDDNTKFANVRKRLLKKLNINLQDLCPSEYMKTISRLLNPNSIDDTMNICHYIKDFQSNRPQLNRP